MYRLVKRIAGAHLGATLAALFATVIVLVINLVVSVFLSFIACKFRGLNCNLDFLIEINYLFLNRFVVYFLFFFFAFNLLLFVGVLARVRKLGSFSSAYAALR